MDDMSGREDVSRLDRMEKKIDRVVEALILLARIDERQVTQGKNAENHEAEIADLKKQVAAMQTVLTRRGAIFKVLDRIFWIVSTAFITFFIATSALTIDKKIRKEEPVHEHKE